MSELAATKFLAILRCTTWANWPGPLAFATRRYVDSTILPAAGEIAAVVSTVFYERRPRPERTPARAAKKISGPRLFASLGRAGYRLGDRIYTAVGDQLPFKIEFERPNQGDLDIKVELATTTPVTIEDISPVANEIATSVIVYANLSLGEPIAPKRRLHVCSVVDGKKSKFSYDVGLHTMQRPIVTIESAAATMSGFETFRRTAGDTLARAISVASKRYISALTEVDAIDRYCDLWEACEIATFDIRAPGKKVGRIAKALADHFFQSSSAKDKTRVETRLGLKDLYDARSNLVHTAIDQPKNFAEQTNLLESVTSELLRYRLGLPPDDRSLAFKRGTAVTPETVNHRGRG